MPISISHLTPPVTIKQACNSRCPAVADDAAGMCSCLAIPPRWLCKGSERVKRGGSCSTLIRRIGDRMIAKAFQNLSQAVPAAFAYAHDVIEIQFQRHNLS